MIHDLSDVKSFIPESTNIWQFCVVEKDVIIGENCNVCASCYLEHGSVIGNNVTIKNGVYIWTGTIIEDNVFIGPNTTFCNDKYPKSKNKNAIFEGVRIKEGSSIGAGCVLLPGITIGKNCLIAAGSVITKDIPDNTKVICKVDYMFSSNVSTPNFKINLK